MSSVRLAVLVAASLLFAACDVGVVPPEIVSWTLDPTTIEAGGDVTSTFELSNFELTGESDHEHDTEELAGDPNHGHVHIYLDDLESNPVLTQVTTSDTVTIPDTTVAGTHTLIGRLHDATHLIIEPQVVMEIDIEVTDVL